MSLPDSYTVKPGSIPVYFEALLNAEAPERFTYKFLENLEFKSTNDRLFVGILKDLGFIDQDGLPKQRYYEFLDKSQSAKVLAEGVREAYSSLFNVNKDAHKLNAEEVKNKLRTLYAGSKTDIVINRIATTFVALCAYADFSAPLKAKDDSKKEDDDTTKKKDQTERKEMNEIEKNKSKSLKIDGLQYHINIVLPESRDQSVYDAIFKSLRDHLGNGHE